MKSWLKTLKTLRPSSSPMAGLERVTEEERGRPRARGGCGAIDLRRTGEELGKGIEEARLNKRRDKERPNERGRVRRRRREDEGVERLKKSESETEKSPAQW